MNNREIEIDLRSLLIYVFEHWRSIIAVSVIITILGGVFGVFRASRANNAAQANEAEALRKLEEDYSTEDDEDEEDDEEADEDSASDKKDKKEKEKDKEEKPIFLNEQQKLAVSRVVDTAKNYYTYRDYVNDSIFLKLDPDKLIKAELTIAITPSTNDNLMAIKDMYRVLADSSESVDYVKEKTKLDISEPELVQVSDFSNASYENESAALTINVFFTGEKECEKITNALLDFLNSKTEAIALAYGSHAVNVITNNVTTIASTSVKNSQNGIHNTLMSYYYAVQDSKAIFVDDQFRYYDELLAEADWDTAEERKSSKIMRKELSDYNDTATELAEEEAEKAAKEAAEAEKKAAKEAAEAEKKAARKAAEAAIEASRQAPISLKKQGIKYGIIALILGMFMMAGFWAVVYIFRNRLDLYDDYESCYGLSELGKVPVVPDKQGIIFDKWIRMWKYAPIKHTEAEACDLIGTQINLLTSKEQLGEVILAVPTSEFNGRNELAQLAASIKSSGGKAEILEDILNNTDNMNKLAKADGVVLVGKAGITRRNDIYQMLALLSRQGVKILGGVTIG